MARAEKILSAVQHLYDGLLEPGGVADALPAVCAAAGASMSLCLTDAGAAGGPPSVFSVGYDPEGIRSFRGFIAHYGLPSWVRTIPIATLRRRSELVADRDFARSAYYNEAIKPMRGFYAILAPLSCPPTQRAHLAVGRERNAGDFDSDDVAALRALAPHFNNVLRLRHRLSAERVDHASAFSILDRLATGVIVLDVTKRHVFVNARAESIAAKRDPLILSKLGVAAATPTDTRKLQQAIAAALELASRSSSASDVRPLKTKLRLCLARHSSNLPLMVTVVPVRASSATGWTNTAPRAALFLTEPERSEEIDPKLLAGCLNLAPREAALAVLLARGADLAEAAAVLRIGLGTARWYLKRVLEKTHTHRQSELIRVLAGFADPLS